MLLLSDPALISGENESVLNTTRCPSELHIFVLTPKREISVARTYPSSADALST